MATVIDRVADGYAHQRAALDVANRVRIGMADVKREIGEGRLSIAKALDDPRAAGMTIFDLLLAQRRWSSRRTADFLEPLRISELRRVDSLTPRQRSFLAARCSSGRAA